MTSLRCDDELLRRMVLIDHLLVDTAFFAQSLDVARRKHAPASPRHSTRSCPPCSPTQTPPKHPCTLAPPRRWCTLWASHSTAREKIRTNLGETAAGAIGSCDPGTYELRTLTEDMDRSAAEEFLRPDFFGGGTRQDPSFSGREGQGPWQRQGQRPCGQAQRRDEARATPRQQKTRRGTRRTTGTRTKPRRCSQCRDVAAHLYCLFLEECDAWPLSNDSGVEDKKEAGF